MTTQTNDLKNLYKRLDLAGIKKTYIKKNILPSWWKDEIAKLPTGLLQLKIHLARHLGLNLETVLDENKSITFNDAGSYRFKQSIFADKKNIFKIKSLAIQAAQISHFATTIDYTPLPNKTESIRQQILKENQNISFPVLLDFCWKSGIPVLHISNFPQNKNRIDGMVINVKNKPIIIITKNNKKYAWLLFILAHELGHIAKLHLKENETLIDGELRNLKNKQKEDKQEEEANAFTLELLTGEHNTRFHSNEQWLTGEQLAKAAQEYGSLNHIDPGHIALNYGYTMNLYAIANKALNILEKDTDAISLIRQKMRENLDFEKIPEDSADFLCKISGINI